MPWNVWRSEDGSAELMFSPFTFTRVPEIELRLSDFCCKRFATKLCCLPPNVPEKEKRLSMS